MVGWNQSREPVSRVPTLIYSGNINMIQFFKELGEKLPIYEKPHELHDQHLCKIFESGVSVEQWRELVAEPKYFCRQCGRAASKAENICDPVAL